jgi:enamine deaminase RidA (YjgF/YER057c/UK114 family)
MTKRMVKKIPGFPVYHGGKKMAWTTGHAVWNPGGIVFLSGAEGRDPDTDKVREGIKAQAKLALERIKERLEDFGTSLENILHIFYFVVGPDFPNGVQGDQKWKDVGEVLTQFWKDNGVPQFCYGNCPPAATLLGISALALKEMLIEIQVVAALPPLGD